MKIEPKHYTIQVMGAQSRKAVDRFIEIYRKEDPVYFIHTERDGKDWYMVLYGDYPDKSSAMQAVTALPEVVKGNSPWPRRLSEVQGIIKAQSAH